ncbi:hypothetical protein [uncultured Leptotrichia sp.]|jgi:hypothetical protein|uniref:hypothetical protein n=2 Tax=Leptotrichia TaxID=32067 RepID=UPI0025D7F1B9|nr:hypothetical protein [uncultured Leptotrichia sp.]
MKKIIVICLLFINIAIFSKEQTPIIYDEDMFPGNDLEMLFESPNDGMASKMILYFSGNLYVYFRQDLFKNISEKFTITERYEQFMSEESLRDYFLDHHVPAIYEGKDVYFLYGRVNLEREHLILELYFIDEKTNELKIKIFREMNRDKINAVERIVEKINEEKYPVPKTKLTTVPKENIAIITRKIKYFGSDRGISGNYKELYEKVIEIFSDKLPSVIHYIRKSDFELIN